MGKKNKDKFKAGDVVTLKSGGPQMTVDKVDKDKVDVTWFDDGGNPRRHNFQEALLEGPLKSAN